jgi:hypothetical protein
MPRSMVGLLAAVGAAMSALVALAHGDVALVLMAAVCGTATGSAAYLALPSKKNALRFVNNVKSN